MIADFIGNNFWCFGPLLLIGGFFVILAIGKGKNNQIH